MSHKNLSSVLFSLIISLLQYCFSYPYQCVRFVLLEILQASLGLPIVVWRKFQKIRRCSSVFVSIVLKFCTAFWTCSTPQTKTTWSIDYTLIYLSFSTLYHSFKEEQKLRNLNTAFFGNNNQFLFIYLIITIIL